MTGNDSAPAKAALLPFLLLYGWVGVFMGSVAGYHYLAQPMSLEPMIGAVVGGAIGIAIGSIAAVLAWRKSVQHTEAAQQVAQQLGGEYLAGDAEVNRRLGTDFSFADASMSDVVRKDLGGVRAEIGDLQITRKGGRGDNETTTNTVQSAAFFVADGLHFPQFMLQPGGVMLKLVDGVLGGERIEFPAQPQFAQIYHLSAVRADDTRRLFDDGILDCLIRRPNLRIQTAADALLLYEPGRQFEGAQLEGFFSEAAKIFRLFEASARSLKLGMQSELRPKQDVRALAENLPGLLGRIVRNSLVTREDVSAFVQQAPPRAIPANIWRYADKFAPGLVLLVGIVFCVAGAAFAGAFGYEALASGAGLMGNKGAGAIIGLAVLAVGIGTTYLAGRARIRIKRLLRDGQVGAGRIEKLEATNLRVSNQAIWQMTAQFQAAGRTVQATCKIPGAAVQRARKLAEEKKPAPILFDPADPQRILFIEALLTVSPDYET